MPLSETFGTLTETWPLKLPAYADPEAVRLPAPSVSVTPGRVSVAWARVTPSCTAPVPSSVRVRTRSACTVRPATVRSKPSTVTAIRPAAVSTSTPTVALVARPRPLVLADDLGREAAHEASGAEADGAVAVRDGEQATERGADLGEGQGAADAAVGGDRAADRHPAAEGDAADGEGGVGGREREGRGGRGGVQAQGEDTAVEGGARDREGDRAGERAGRADPGRSDREGACAAGEGQERRAACAEGGPQVAHRDGQAARGQVGDGDVGGERLAEHAQGQAGGADVTRGRRR